MCAYIDYEGQGTFRRIPPPTAELIERTRKVERELPGELVPEGAWATFFAVACGTMNMGHFQRMFQARRIALSYMALQNVRYGRIHGSAGNFRCVGD